MKIVYDFPGAEDKTIHTLHKLYYRLWKYKILWALRRLEDEVERDGADGVIILPDIEGEHDFIVHGFPLELEDKVKAAMLALDKE